MEKRKPNEENEMVKALEDIHFENQNLQQCLKKIVTTRRLLEAKLDPVTSQLASVVEENYNLEDGNLIICGKIEAVEKEANELEDSKTILADTIKKLKEEIKEYKGGFEEKINNFVQASDYLTAGFLFAVSNNEQVEEECSMRLTADLDKIKDEIMEKENNVAKLKKELEEDDFYDFPEDPVELQVKTEERQFIMNMLENNLKNATQQLENLYKLKTKKEIEENEV